MADIEIVSGEPQLATLPFSGDERKKFDRAWKAIVRYYNRYGRLDLFDIEHMEGIMYCAQAYKAKKNLSFDGLLPQGGFGMRPITIRDIVGTRITSTEWDVNWTTAGIRSWLFNHTVGVGNNPIGGAQVSDAFGAHEAIVPRDANNDEWGIAVLGVGTFHASPKVKAVRIEQNRATKGDLIVENQLRNSEQALSDAGRIFYMSPGIPFAFGVEVRTVGLDAVYPVGVTFGTVTRFRQTAANITNQCQSA